jgi:hypothetical protein
VLSQKSVLIAMMLVLLINVLTVILGAWMGHNGLFEFGSEIGKVVFGTVVGALASAFSSRGDGGSKP